MAARTRRAARARASWHAGSAAPTRSSASTMPASSPSASASTGWSIAGCFHEIGSDRRQAPSTTADGNLRRSDAGQLRDGPRPDRRPAGRRGRRRFHRARRLGRRDDHAKSRLHGRADARTSLRVPIDPHHRRLGRRRLGQDDRDHRPRQPAGPCVGSDLPWCCTTTIWASCRWSALGLGSVAGLGAARLAASHYSVMVQGNLGAVRRRPAGGERAAAGQAVRQAGAGRLGDQTRGASVDHAVDTEDEAFDCTRRFLSYLPSSVFEVASARFTHRRSPNGREEFPVRGDPARPPQGLPDAPDRRGGGRQGVVSSRWAGMFGRGYHHRPRAA